jgi:hypothetical protein
MFSSTHCIAYVPMEKKINLSSVEVENTRKWAASIGASYERMYKECLRDPWMAWRSGASCTISVSVKADEEWCSGPLLSKAQQGSITRSWAGLFGVPLSCNGKSTTLGELLELTDINPKQLSNAKSRVLAAGVATKQQGLREAKEKFTNSLIDMHTARRKELRLLEQAQAAEEASVVAAEEERRADQEEQQEFQRQRRAMAATGDDDEVRTKMHLSYTDIPYVEMCRHELLSHSKVRPSLAPKPCICRSPSRPPSSQPHGRGEQPELEPDHP